MFCSKCGKQCGDIDKFCANCGNPLSVAAPVTNPQNQNACQGNVTPDQNPGNQMHRLYFDAKGLTLFNYVFEIRDEAGNVRYKAKTVTESMIRYNAQLLDAYDRELIKVSQQSKLTFAAMNFDFLYPNGCLITEAIQNFGIVNYTYDLKSFGITITGNFLKLSFDFVQNGQTIARIEKKFFSWGDCYELTYLDPSLEQLFLASVLMIQLVCAASRHRRR